MPELKEVRTSKAAEAKRFTVKAMADVLGVSEPTYRKFEADPDRLTLAQAKTLAKHLGCRVEDLFYLPVNVS